jgi:hypothetical protein
MQTDDSVAHSLVLRLMRAASGPMGAEIRDRMEVIALSGWVGKQRCSAAWREKKWQRR